MNTSKKYNIGIICGGQSVEHSISLCSAVNIARSLSEYYSLTIIYIDRQGTWHHIVDQTAFLNDSNHSSNLAENLYSEAIMLYPNSQGALLRGAKSQQHFQVDLFFPVLHGMQGEDGSIQGLLELLNQPYVGNSIVGSSISMNKILSKQLLSKHNIPTLPFEVITKQHCTNTVDIIETLGLPLFVKPAHLGSSIGISKVTHETMLKQAIDTALRLDSHVLIEKGIKTREIECAIIKDNDKLICAVPGEIVPKQDFYSFNAKYKDPKGAELLCPAPLSNQELLTVTELAKQCFNHLQLDGFARIDFFLTNDGYWYFNEANPIPGFTEISMFSKCFEQSGLTFSSLLQIMINHAMNMFNNKKHQRECSEHTMIKI